MNLPISLALLKYLPDTVAAVKAAEVQLSTFPQSGAAKKEIVLSVIEVACKVGEVIPNPLIQGFSTLVDALVQILNERGIFSHTQPQPKGVT